MKNKETGFHKLKQERTDYFNKYINHWVVRPCTACNGSGYYDSFENPYCGACDGKGTECFKPNYVEGLTHIEYHIGEKMYTPIDDETDLEIYINKRREIIYQYKRINKKTPKIRRRLHFEYLEDGDTDWQFTDLEGNKFSISMFNPSY